jgi:hypothetical protein
MKTNPWRVLYLIAAGLFVLGLLAQVYLVGLSLLGGRPSWESHIGLGHSLGGAALLMVVFAYLGRLPRQMKSLTWTAFVTYILLADIVIFMRDSAPLAAALHPVLAVLLFAVTATLAIRAWQLVRKPQVDMAVAGERSAVSSTIG